MKKPTKVCAYRDIIRRRWSDILPKFSKDRAFSGSNAQLQATWHSKAASYMYILVFQPYSLYRAFAFVVFRILSVTGSLTRALSQSRAHVQQLFSASTPSQVLAPRFCTLVLFIIHVYTCSCYDFQIMVRLLHLQQCTI